MDRTVSDEGTVQIDRAFAAMSDPIRRDLVARLCEGDATVTALARPYDVSVQAISKHVKVLEAAGLVSRVDDSHRSPVHLEAQVFDLMTGWIERHRRRAEERFRRLDAVLADLDDTGRQLPPAQRTRTRTRTRKEQAS